MPRGCRVPVLKARRLSLVVGAIAAAMLGQVGCRHVPRHVDGVPGEAPWTSLPLRSWLAEDRAFPEAVAACFTRDCAERLAVGVFRVSGDGARQAAAVLRDPEPLAAYLRSRDAADTSTQRRQVRTEVSVRPLRVGRLEGFAISISRQDGARGPAHGAALGAMDGGSLRFVMVVGDDAEAVEATARRVAERQFGG